MFSLRQVFYIEPGRSLVRTLMDWPIFALCAPLFWAASNLVDARLLEGRVANPISLVIITGLCAGVPAIVAFVTGSFQWIGWTNALLAVSAGIAGVAVYFPYLIALQRAPVSSVVLMWNLAPIFVVVLAWMVVHERLQGPEYVAIVLLVASSMLAAYQRGRGRGWSQGLPWMIIASGLTATEAILQKILFQNTSFSAGYPWISLSSFICAVVVAVANPEARRILATAFRGRTAAILFANEFLDVAAAVASSRAMSLGPVSLVHAFGGLQPLFILALTGLFGAAPRTRALGRGHLARTAIAIGLAVVGLGLVGSTHQ